MEAEEFQKKLYQAQELMSAEEFDSAKEILDKLKEIEKQGDFDFNLTHKLYQLISNLESLMNQKEISGVLGNLSKLRDKISIEELEEILNKKELNFEEGILQREIELLILRGLINLKIDGNIIYFR